MNYWIVIDRQKFGPLTLEEARRMPLRRDSYVWHTGLPTWVRADKVAALADLFDEPVADSQSVSPDETPTVTEPVPAPPAPAPAPPPPAPPYPAPPRSSRPPKPMTYLGWSIAAVICCCFIPAIVAVIYSTKVTPLYEQGRFTEAVKASERAELWLIIAITAGIVALPFQMVFALM